METKMFESSNTKCSSSKFHPRFLGDVQTSGTTSVRNCRSLRKHGVCIRDKNSATSKKDEKFFFSNMLRSLLHKNRVLNGRKCRVEIPGLKRKIQETKRETTEKNVMGLINVPDNFFPYPDFVNTNLRYPFGFPWNCWPLSSELQPLTSRFYDALPSPSSSTSFPMNSANVGRLFRDVPLGELWLRQPEPNVKLPAMHTVEETISPFCGLNRHLGLFNRAKLGSSAHKFRPHLLSAFSVPEAKRFQETSEPKVNTTQPNVHYILRNLRSIYGTDCRTVVVDAAPKEAIISTSTLQDHNQSREDQDDHTNEGKQTSPQISPDCRQFSALIGLEIVVDYVKKND